MPGGRGISDSATYGAFLAKTVKHGGKFSFGKKVYCCSLRFLSCGRAQLSNRKRPA